MYIHCITELDSELFSVSTSEMLCKPLWNAEWMYVCIIHVHHVLASSLVVTLYYNTPHFSSTAASLVISI